MKKLSLSVLLCSITLSLAACGDNFLAANVSLGGSGSGTKNLYLVVTIIHLIRLQAMVMSAMNMSQEFPLKPSVPVQA